MPAKLILSLPGASVIQDPIVIALAVAPFTNME